MRTTLEHLKPGDCFRLGDQAGTLVKCNFCRATVRLDKEPADVSFLDKNGNERSFAPASGTIKEWAPGTEVEKMEHDES